MSQVMIPEPVPQPEMRTVATTNICSPTPKPLSHARVFLDLDSWDQFLTDRFASGCDLSDEEEKQNWNREGQMRRTTALATPTNNNNNNILSGYPISKKRNPDKEPTKRKTAKTSPSSRTRQPSRKSPESGYKPYDADEQDEVYQEPSNLQQLDNTEKEAQRALSRFPSSFMHSSKGSLAETGFHITGREITDLDPRLREACNIVRDVYTDPAIVSLEGGKLVLDLGYVAKKIGVTPPPFLISHFRRPLKLEEMKQIETRNRQIMKDPVERKRELEKEAQQYSEYNARLFARQLRQTTSTTNTLRSTDISLPNDADFLDKDNDTDFQSEEDEADQQSANEDEEQGVSESEPSDRDETEDTDSLDRQSIVFYRNSGG